MTISYPGSKSLTGSIKMRSSFAKFDATVAEKTSNPSASVKLLQDANGSSEIEGAICLAAWLPSLVPLLFCVDDIDLESSAVAIPVCGNESLGSPEPLEFTCSFPLSSESPLWLFEPSSNVSHKLAGLNPLRTRIGFLHVPSLRCVAGITSSFESISRLPYYARARQSQRSGLGRLPAPL